jgi:hypothetical protein
LLGEFLRAAQGVNGEGFNSQSKKRGPNNLVCGEENDYF